jgi:arylsulfatase A-like enzyme
MVAPRHATLFSGLAPFRPPNFNEEDMEDKPGFMRNRDPVPEAQADVTRLRMLRAARAVDEGVGAILATLRDLGVERDTIVVFTSDHGYYLGEHRVLAKYKSYEEDIRIPLVVRYPRVAPLPRSEERLALNLDVAPTFAELAGTMPTLLPDGRSLLRVLDGTAEGWRRDFMTEGWPGGKEWVTVHEARFKWTENRLGQIDELYDLETDPFELENLYWDPVLGEPSGAHPGIVEAMAARLREFRPGWPDDAVLE